MGTNVKTSKKRRAPWKDHHCWLCGTKGDFNLFPLSKKQQGLLAEWEQRIKPSVRALIDTLAEIRLCAGCQKRTKIKNYQEGGYGG